MTAVLKETFDTITYTNSAQLENECVSLEESRRRVKDLVHKHFMTPSTACFTQILRMR